MHSQCFDMLLCTPLRHENLEMTDSLHMPLLQSFEPKSGSSMNEVHHATRKRWRKIFLTLNQKELIGFQYLLTCEVRHATRKRRRKIFLTLNQKEFIGPQYLMTSDLHTYIDWQKSSSLTLTHHFFRIFVVLGIHVQHGKINQRRFIRW